MQKRMQHILVALVGSGWMNERDGMAARLPQRALHLPNELLENGYGKGGIKTDGSEGCSRPRVCPVFRNPEMHFGPNCILIPVDQKNTCPRIVTSESAVWGTLVDRNRITTQFFRRMGVLKYVARQSLIRYAQLAVNKMHEPRGADQQELNIF